MHRYSLAGHSALKVAIAVFVVAYAIVAHWGGRVSPRGEFFPVFNWSLFTTVHDRRVLLEIYVHQIGEQKFAKPVNYFELDAVFPSARRRSTELKKTLERWFAAGVQGNVKEMSRLREVLEKTHMRGNGAVTYDIRWVEFRPVERWKSGRVLKEQVLVKYTTGVPT